jgi:hypothetical protein
MMSQQTHSLHTLYYFSHNINDASNQQHCSLVSVHCSWRILFNYSLHNFSFVLHLTAHQIVITCSICRYGLNYPASKSHPCDVILFSIVNYFEKLAGSTVFLAKCTIPWKIHSNKTWVFSPYFFLKIPSIIEEIIYTLTKRYIGNFNVSPCISIHYVLWSN